MAVTVIQNSCVAGVMGALSARRFSGAILAASYALNANIARAVADAFITANTASGAAIADADNAQVGPLVQSVAFGVIEDRYPQAQGTPASTDYTTLGSIIYAAAKQAIAKLI
jgi:hypothetical protein